MDLNRLLPLLREAKATAPVAAIEAWQRSWSMHERLTAEGHAAHQAPHHARRAHHAAVVAAVSAGEHPAEASLRTWDAVEDADADLSRWKAVVAASEAGVGHAAAVATEMVSRSWSTVVPTIAAGVLAGDGERWEPLYSVLSWPSCDPCLYLQRDLRVHCYWPPTVSRRDLSSPDEAPIAALLEQWRLHCWTALAERSWTEVSPGVIRLPDFVVSSMPERLRGYHFVMATSEEIAQHERNITLGQRGDGVVWVAR